MTLAPFSGIEVLPPGAPLSTDGYKFPGIDRLIIDRILRVGAVTHVHDGHAALANPVLAPVVTTANSGGAIPASTAIYITYTLFDADGGESLPVDVVTITTAAGFSNPFDALTAVVDYAAGTLLAGNFSYAATVTDGLGGETELSPAVVATVAPGNANAEVTLSGLSALVTDASGGAPGAGWRLWRSKDSGPWYLIGTGPEATDGFLDDGVVGDCTVQPPGQSTTVGANTLVVNVPGGQPADAASFGIYASLDGSFISPALLAILPIADAGVDQTFTSLVPIEGAPPGVSTCLPGATLISPGVTVVDTFVDLPATPTSGQVAITMDTLTIWSWEGSFWIQPRSEQIVDSSNVDRELNIYHVGGVVELTGALPTNVNIPPSSEVLLPLGAIIRVFQHGTGPVTIVPLAGVTLDAPGGARTRSQYAELTLWQRAIDEWVVIGQGGAPRVATVAQAATPTINTDIMDVASITGLATAITSMTTNLTGTPADGDELVIRITDNGVARAITWGAKFEASTVALPATTVAGALLFVRFAWNPATSKWRCILVA